MYKEYLAEFWYSTKALENSKVSFFIPTDGIYDEVGVNTFRNAIGAHYLPHSSEYVALPSIDIVRSWFETIGYGETVPAKWTLKKSLLLFFLLVAQIIQCLGGKTRGFDQITNKDAIILYSLANGINIDYASIFWEDIIIKLNKRHREKVVPYTRFLSLLMMHKMKEGYGDGEVTPYPTQVFSVNNWALKPNQPEEPPFIDHMLDIRTAAKPVPGAKPRHKKHLTSSKEPLVSSSEATKVGSSEVPTGSKIVHLERKKESSSAMDSNPSQTSASTSVAAEMHKEDQQATGGPASLGVTSKARSNPKLSSGMSAFNLNEPIYSASLIIHSESASGNDASAVSTAEVDLVKSAPSDFIPQQYGMNEGTKNTSYDHLFAGTDPHVLADKTQSVSEGLEVVLTQPTIGKGASSIARQIEEDEASRTINDEDKKADKVHATTNAETEDASVPKSSSPRSSKIQELTNQFNELTEEVKGLKKQVHNLEIEQPRELKEIPTKLEDFTKTVTSLTSQVAELKTLQWELLAEFLSLPTQVKMIQAKLKTLDALPSLLHKVTNALNQFAQAIASKKIKDNSVTSAGQVGTQPAKGEKNTNQATISYDYDDDETHVTGSMVESSRIKKVKKFDFVTEDGKHIHLTKEQINQQKKIEEEAKAKAAKHECEVRKEELVDLLGLEVVNKKGPITIKVYKQDGTSEIIPNFKASDLHLGEWKEAMNACPNRTRKGWTTIYDQIRSKMDYIYTTEAELDINLDIPLGKQDPLDKLNDLTNKKRKHADDIDDYFKANRRLKTSVQYEDHLAGTVLNELVLGLGLDDHAKTFSSLLLAQVDKRNLNPLKQMRTIKPLRFVPSCFAIFTFEPLTLSLTSMPSCDLKSLTNILILCLILKASNQSLRKTLSLNLELS
ncbi:hypothetical protein Tco_0135185 [Tanacetum coccineum]